MKKLILTILLMSFALIANSQEYLHDGGYSDEMSNLIILQPAKGFNFCQKNQNILYDRALEDSNENLNYLAETIDDERTISPTSFRLKHYESMFLSLVINHILLTKMKQQMADKSLYQRYLDANKPNAKSFLGMNEINISLADEFSTTLRKEINLSNLSVSSVKYLEHSLLKSTLARIASGSYEFLLSKEGPKIIASALKGIVTREIFKKAVIASSISFTKDVLISVGKGTALDLLTFPLHAYNSSDETQWLDTLEIAPALILNPDLKVTEDKSKSVGVLSAQNWRTHCLALSRKTSQMEYRFDKMQEDKKNDFMANLNFIKKRISNSNAKLFKIEPTKIDKTAVYRKRIIL